MKNPISQRKICQCNAFPRTVLKLYHRNFKPLNNDNVLQIKFKSNLNLDKLQTIFFPPSLVIPFFLPIDIHPTVVNWNPKCGLTHTHNPRIRSDLRSYILLRSYLSCKNFLPLNSSDCIWNGKEDCRQLLDTFLYRTYGYS